MFMIIIIGIILISVHLGWDTFSKDLLQAQHLQHLNVNIGITIIYIKASEWTSFSM